MTKNAVAAIQNQATRHVQSQQREKHPRGIQCADVDVQFAPGDVALPPGDEETDPVDGGHVGPLPGQRQPNDAGKYGRHEIDGTGGVKNQRWNRRHETVGDVRIETP